MRSFIDGVGVIAQLELRQRVRGTAWYVLLGIFAALVAIVTVLLAAALPGLTGGGGNAPAGAGVYSAIIYFVLLLSTLVAPALSGNAINGDREAGTLATTQITLISTWQLIVGKFLAAWATALAFLAVTVPFIVFTAVIGGLDPATVIVSLLVLALELGVVAAIGVGLSGLLTRPLFSIVVTYLVVAALSVGTLIAFTLGGLVVQSETRSTISTATNFDPSTGQGLDCRQSEVTRGQVPRFDYFWGFLAANPYVVLADAVPAQFGPGGNARDLFGFIKSTVRGAQLPPVLDRTIDECALPTAEQYSTADQYSTAEEIVESTVPGWFVGLGIHFLLAALALGGAWRSTRTPAGRLSRGSRVA